MLDPSDRSRSHQSVINARDALPGGGTFRSVGPHRDRRGAVGTNVRAGAYPPAARHRQRQPQCRRTCSSRSSRLLEVGWHGPGLALVQRRAARRWLRPSKPRREGDDRVVCLPVALAPACSRRRRSRRETAARAATILLVEDEASVGRILTRAGYRVLAAATPRSVAFDVRLRHRPPLTDVVAPHGRNWRRVAGVRPIRRWSSCRGSNQMLAPGSCRRAAFVANRSGLASRRFGRIRRPWPA